MINFGKWSRKKVIKFGIAFIWKRIYFKKYKWTPFLRLEIRRPILYDYL